MQCLNLNKTHPIIEKYKNNNLVTFRGGAVESNFF